MMHIGVDTTLSKSEAMYFPPPRVDYSTADTSRLYIISTVGFVDFTKEFKYLGSIIGSSLTSDADVGMRIKAATSAFGALKNVLTSLSVDLREKGRVFRQISDSGAHLPQIVGFGSSESAFGPPARVQQRL